MARPLRIEYKDVFYHIIQRGIERKRIFLKDADKDKFFSYLSQAFKRKERKGKRTKSLINF